MKYFYTKPDLRRDFYKVIKNDFIEMSNHITYSEFISNLTTLNNGLFKAGVESASFEEFELLISNLRLKDEKKQIKKKNKKLKKDLKESNKLTNTIVTSNSWLITKPLRLLKKLIK